MRWTPRWSKGAARVGSSVSPFGGFGRVRREDSLWRDGAEVPASRARQSSAWASYSWSACHLLEHDAGWFSAGALSGRVRRRRWRVRSVSDIPPPDAIRFGGGQGVGAAFGQHGTVAADLFGGVFAAGADLPAFPVGGEEQVGIGTAARCAVLPVHVGGDAGVRKFRHGRDESLSRMGHWTMQWGVPVWEGAAGE